jgi:hypothetical protein
MDGLILCLWILEAYGSNLDLGGPKVLSILSFHKESRLTRSSCCVCVLVFVCMSLFFLCDRRQATVEQRGYAVRF